MGLSTTTSSERKGLRFPHSWALLVTLPFNQDINQIIVVEPQVELHLECKACYLVWPDLAQSESLKFSQASFIASGK